nr:uncharacterized protein LOC116430435 isoform X1 [Nomia melanderi]
MKLALLALLSFLLEAHCVLVSSEPKGNETELEQRRSARVHRVASDDFYGKEDVHAKNIVDVESTEQTFRSGSQKEDVSLADTVLPITTESETKFSKHMDSVNRVLNEWSREVTVAARNDDLAFNGMTEMIESPAFIKLLPKNVHGLRNPLNSPELMDISYSDNSNVVKKTESGPKYGETDDFQLRTIRTVGLYFERLLAEIQDHATYIQNVIEKLCRRHRSKTPRQSEVDGPVKFS